MTNAVSSYCCSAVERPFESPRPSPACSPFALLFRGFGIGVMNSANRRSPTIWFVG